MNHTQSDVDSEEAQSQHSKKKKKFILIPDRRMLFLALSGLNKYVNKTLLDNSVINRLHMETSYLKRSLDVESQFCESSEMFSHLIQLSLEWIVCSITQNTSDVYVS